MTLSTEADASDTPPAQSDSTTSPIAPETLHEWLGEFRMLVETGRMRRLWHRPISEAFTRVGLGGDFSPAVWKELAWYGVLEEWVQPGSGVTDICLNRPGQEVFITQHGQTMPSGITPHPSWIAWTQRQLLLRTSIVTPEAPEAWPAPMLLGCADRRLRFALTRVPLTPRGPSFAVRVLPERWRTLDDLVIEGVLPRAAADLLVAALRSTQASILVAGSTGSGKTTLTAALLQATGIGDVKRAVVIEDGGELPEIGNSLHTEVLYSGTTFAQCVSFALRQKPDLIIVGEVRGGEALALLQAAATGHPGIGTIHAPNVQAALRNLERHATIGLAAESGGSAAAATVRGLIASDAVNLIVVHLDIVPSGQRSITSIEEVLPMSGAGQSGERYATNVLWAYDGAAQQVVWRGPVHGPWGLGRF